MRKPNLSSPFNLRTYGAGLLSFTLALGLGCDPADPDTAQEPDATQEPEDQPSPDPQPDPTDPTNPTDPYDPATLEAYKRALPKSSVLQAPQPSSSSTAVIGDPAEFPGYAVDQITAVNNEVTGLLAVLDQITDLEPTFFDADTQEFVWGPFDNEDSALEGDNVLLYIKDEGAGADFRYTYAFIRLMGEDFDNTAVPVIWGGANITDEALDYGNGIILWDFVANNDFELANNPTPEQDVDGRFVVAYSNGPDDNNADAIVTIVVSVFRDFIFDPNEPAANFEQLYGHVTENGDTYDFVDIETELNIYPEEGDGSANENLSLRMAFFNEGSGRGEAVFTGGDLAGATAAEDSTIAGIECWDQFVARDYYGLYAEGPITDGQTLNDDGLLVIAEEATMAECGGPFVNSLRDIGVPTLEDVGADLLTALDDVATNGLGE